MNNYVLNADRTTELAENLRRSYEALGKATLKAAESRKVANMDESLERQADTDCQLAQYKLLSHISGRLESI